MSVIINDRRSVWNEADVATNFNTGTQNLTDYIESIACISVAFNETFPATSVMYATETALNLTDTLIYVWIAHIAILESQANGGMTLYIGDGTNNLGLYLGGSDVLAFQHFDGPVLWQCFVIDQSKISELNDAGFVATYDGAFGSVDWTQITRIGGGWITYSKALGGGVNCFLDIMRYGNGGLDIVGGTTGDRGTFSDMVSGDKHTGDLNAYGVIREYSTGVFGVQGSLTFGASGIGDSWFDDTGSTIVFENRNISDDKLIFRVLGDETGGEETHFILNGAAISTAGPLYLVDFSDAGIDELDIQGSIFSGAYNLYLGNDSDALNHVFSNTTISNCGTFFPGIVPIRNCTFAETLDSESIQVSSGVASGAFYWEDGGVDVEDSTFRDNTRIAPSGTAGIIHPSGGSFTYQNLRFSGNDFDILFLGTGTLTILAQGTSNPTTYSAPNGGTVDIQNTKTLTLTGIVSGTEVRIQTARGAAPSGAELFHVENTTGADVIYQYNYTGDFDVDIIIHNVLYTYLRIDDLTLTDENASVPIQQELDRWYSNP